MLGDWINTNKIKTDWITTLFLLVPNQFNISGCLTDRNRVHLPQNKETMHKQSDIVYYLAVLTYPNNILVLFNNTYINRYIFHHFVTAKLVNLSH